MDEDAMIVSPRLEDFPIHTVDLEFPQRIFSGAPPEDVPILRKVVMALGAVSWETLPMTVRSLTNIQLSNDELEYTISVRLPRTHRIDFDTLHDVWSTAPTNMVAIVVGPWYDDNTGVLYLNINAIVRRAQAPMSGRFVMLQHMRRSLRLSRRAQTAHQSGAASSTRALLLRAGADKRGADAEDAADAGFGHSRTPWDVVSNAADRDVVHSVVMLCKDMATCTSQSEFWDQVRVRENVPGYADRLVVRWRMPANTLVDSLMGAVLRARHPQAVECIHFSLDDHAVATRKGNGSWFPVVVEITLYSVACDILNVCEATTLNLFTSMRNRTSGGGAVIKVAGPSQCPRRGADHTTDPVVIAQNSVETRAPQQKRSLDIVDDGKHDAVLVGDDDDDDDSGGAEVVRPRAKRQRVSERQSKTRDRRRGLYTGAVTGSSSSSSGASGGSLMNPANLFQGLRQSLGL